MIMSMLGETVFPPIPRSTHPSIVVKFDAIKRGALMFISRGIKAPERPSFPHMAFVPVAPTTFAVVAAGEKKALLLLLLCSPLTLRWAGEAVIDASGDYDGNEA